jgi:hypothetical protein
MIQNLPLRWYTFANQSHLTTNLSKQTLVDISNQGLYTRVINPSETLYSISEELYGTFEYYWILAQINNISDVELSFIKTDYEFERFIDSLNGEPRQEILFYENEDRIPQHLHSIDLTQYRDEFDFITSNKLKAVSRYTFEKRKHEASRILYYLSQQSIDIMMEKQLLNSII